MIFGTTSIKIESTLLKSRIQEIKSISNQYIQSSGYQEPIKSLSRAYQDFCSSILTFLHCISYTVWWSFPKPAKLDLASWSFPKPAKLDLASWSFPKPAKLDLASWSFTKPAICPCQNKYGLFQNLLVFKSMVPMTFSKAIPG